MSSSLPYTEHPLTPEAVWGPAATAPAPVKPRSAVRRSIDLLTRIVSLALLLAVAALGCAFLTVWLPQRRTHVVMQEVIARGGEIATRPCFDSGFRGLMGFSDIIALTLREQTLESGWCDRLRPMQQLVRLDLEGCRIPAADGGFLSELPRLEYLNLSRTGSGDGALQALAPVARLKGLELNRCSITDAAWPTIQRHPLQWLKLDDTRLTASTLRQIAKLSELQGLSLSGTAVTDKIVTAWPAEGRLEWLSLNRTMIGDESLAWIAQQRRLKYLELAGTQVTDDGLQSLAALRQLEWIDLSDTKISDESVTVLHPAQLTALDLSGTQVTDECIDWLTRCQQLTWADLRNTRITTAAAEQLRQALPKAKFEL
jgi:Leucine-rich repeat (LRR) protein